MTFNDLMEEICNITIRKKNESASGIYVRLDKFVSHGISQHRSNSMVYGNSFIDIQIDDGETMSREAKGPYLIEVAPTHEEFRAKNQIRIAYVKRNSFLAVRIAIAYSTLIENCGGEISSREGFVTIPEIDGSFDCIWIIRENPGNGIRASVTALSVPYSPNCTDSYLEFRKWNASGPLIGRWCEKTASMFAMVNLIHFLMENFIPNCGGEISSREGFVTIPEIDGSFDCIWIIRENPGNGIRASVTALSVPYSPNCTDSYLEFRKWNASGPLIGRWCEKTASMFAMKTIPNELYLEEEVIWMKFRYVKPNKEDEMDENLEKPTMRVLFTRLHGGSTTSHVIQQPLILMEEVYANLIWTAEGEPDKDLLVHIDEIKIPEENIEGFDGINKVGLFLSEALDNSNVNYMIPNGRPGSVRVVGFVPPADDESRNCLQTFETIIVTSQSEGLLNIRHLFTLQDLLVHIDEIKIPEENIEGFDGINKVGLFLSEALDNSNVNYMIPNGRPGSVRVVGFVPPADIYLPYSRMEVSFFAPPRSEFKLTWQSVPKRNIINGTENETAPNKTKVYSCGSSMIPTWDWQEIRNPLPPGKDSGYENDIHCRWTIERPLMTGIQIKFTMLSLEDLAGCPFDFISIVPDLDNSQNNEDVFYYGQKYCRSSQVNTTLDYSYNKILYVHFVSDRSRSGRGFLLKFRLTCNSFDYIRPSYGLLDHILTNPGYPKLETDQKCMWSIVVASNRRVGYEILDLDLQKIDQCTKDVLSVVIY
ncbi:CUB domain protein [Dictyocaulus viviparus]|uniref:CUB domain protein n=1 Tax=Dictyocaulus viviparus TaxID=29172 RepID=A0A0D8Y3M7_DICVI|nr:CUB domain protein [Dictyocaulus viviparus]